MNIKLIIILIIISIFSTSIYGIEKITSQYSPDTAQINIGLSSIDSSSCSVCLAGGSGYESGCKRCIQDGIIFGTKASNGNPFYVGWSNDDAMYHGDSTCDGLNFFPTITSSSGETYWVEILKKDKIIESNIYSESSFNQLTDTLTTTMCSEPTDLRYVRISNEDGKSLEYGGQILGSIDNIKLYEIDENSSKPNLKNLVFEENFEKCSSKTCENAWVLQDPEMLYIDTINKNFRFDSQITQSNDYVHYDLKNVLNSDSWILRFQLQIDRLNENPQGKGILEIEPNIRPIFLIIPFLLILFIVISYIKKIKNQK